MCAGKGRLHLVNDAQGPPEPMALLWPWLEHLGGLCAAYTAQHQEHAAGGCMTPILPLLTSQHTGSQAASPLLAHSKQGKGVHTTTRPSIDRHTHRRTYLPGSLLAHDEPRRRRPGWPLLGWPSSRVCTVRHPPCACTCRAPSACLRTHDGAAKAVGRGCCCWGGGWTAARRHHRG